jgi:hypothetical protein
LSFGLFVFRSASWSFRLFVFSSLCLFVFFPLPLPLPYSFIQPLPLPFSFTLTLYPFPLHLVRTHNQKPKGGEAKMGKNRDTYQRTRALKPTSEKELTKHRAEQRRVAAKGARRGATNASRAFMSSFVRTPGVAVLYAYL